jgi:hypothetical protein
VAFIGSHTKNFAKCCHPRESTIDSRARLLCVLLLGSAFELARRNRVDSMAR